MAKWQQLERNYRLQMQRNPEACANWREAVALLGRQQDAGFELIGDAVKNLRHLNRMALEGDIGVSDMDNTVSAAVIDACREAIPESEVKQLDIAEQMYQMQSPTQRKRTSLQHGPVVGTAVAKYFQLTIKHQHRGFSVTPQDTATYHKLTEALGGVTKASFAEGADATGGYTVPTIVESEVLRIVQDSTVVFQRSRKLPMRSNDVRIPNEATGVTAYWVAEAGNLTQGEGTFGENILTAKKVAARATASIELVQDNVIDLLQYIQVPMAEKLGRLLDLDALEGTGTNFTGLNAEAGINTVATTTTDGEQVAYIDLVNASHQTSDSSPLEGAGWFMHRKIFATIVGLVDSTGQPIFNAPMAAGVPGTIFGYPVYTTSVIATDTTRGSTSNTSNIYFGNPDKLIFGVRSGLSFDVTDAVNWSTYQLDMRMVGRFGFTVATPAAFTRVVGCTLLGA